MKCSQSSDTTRLVQFPVRPERPPHMYALRLYTFHQVEAGQGRTGQGAIPESYSARLLTAQLEVHCTV